MQDNKSVYTCVSVKVLFVFRWARAQTTHIFIPQRFKSLLRRRYDNWRAEHCQPQKKPAGWVVRMTGGAMTGWFIKIIFILETFVVLSSHLYDEFFTVRSVRRLKWLLITTEARFFNESLQLKNNLFTVATDRATIAWTKLNTFQKDTPTES